MFEIYFICAIALLIQVVFGLYHFFGHTARLRNSGKKFQFRFTDLYIVVLCLAPCMWVLAWLIEQNPKVLVPYCYWLVWFVGAVLWMFIGRMHVELPEGKTPGAVGPTLTIFGFSLVSILITILSFVLAGVTFGGARLLRMI